MANFWRDYFQYGTGNKIINTIGGVMLRNKWKDLMSKYNGKQEEESSPTLNQDTSTDTGFDREQGTPKQDLNQQPVPEYQPPTVGGYKPIVSTSEEQQNEQEFGTKTPNAFMDMIGNSNSSQQIPLLNNQDKSKVDFSGIGMMIDPIKRKQYNDKLNTDVLEFMNYAQRFPEQGERYKSMLDMFVKQKQQQAPEKIEVGKEFTDRNGYLYERQYNPYKNEWLTVPVTGQDGKQIQTKLPEMRDLNEIDFYLGENGNAWYRDPTTGVASDSGILYRNRFPKYGLQEDAMTLKEDQFAFKQNNGNNGNRGNNGNNGSDNSSGLSGLMINPNTKKVTLNGVPLQLTTRKVNTGKTYINPETNKEEKLYEDQQVFNVNGKDIPYAEIDKIVGASTKKGLNSYQIQQLALYGIGVTKEGLIDTERTKVAGENQQRSGWVKSNMDAIKNPTKYTTEQLEGAKKWLKDNNDFNLRQGIIDQEVYNYVNNGFRK